MRVGWYARALALCLLLDACTPSSTTPKAELADDQTLRAAIPTEISLDPAQIQHDLEYSVAQNLFGGLYRFDDALREIPDLAVALPDVSADGLVYTIKLRPDSHFWDGHQVTAQDVIYSWNRAIDVNASYASIFQPVAGYQDVENSLIPGEQPLALAGLTSPDSHTIVIRLWAPAGYFATTLAFPVAWVVSEAAVEANRSGWSNEPNLAVGTGPFRLTSRTLGRSTTLVPVEHWWNGPTGRLKKVQIDVVPDANAERKGYLDGQFDLIGLGGYGPFSDGMVVGNMLAADAQHAREVHTFPYGRTDWLGFDVKSGPLAGDGGLWGRRALSLAVDRKLLAKTVCAGGRLCVPATGGLISRGLAGYLGDGSDPMSVFDLKTAKADLEEWDPDGTKRQDITYVYLANSLFRQVADNLRDQWKAHLGINVRLQGYDTATFTYQRVLGDYALFRGSWAADYNNQQDWYDIFASQPNGTGSGYDDPSFIALVAQADASSGMPADAKYRVAGQMLLDQAVVAPLIYFTRTVVVKDYVQGFGANALYAYPLTDVKILQH
jgi:ABC-type oligopeptide transport system substrate-binding subunit